MPALPSCTLCPARPGVLSSCLVLLLCRGHCPSLGPYLAFWPTASWWKISRTALSFLAPPPASGGVSVYGLASVPLVLIARTGKERDLGGGRAGGCRSVPCGQASLLPGGPSRSLDPPGLLPQLCRRTTGAPHLSLRPSE